MTTHYTKAFLIKLVRCASLLSLLFCLAITASAETISDTFNAANKLYEQQKYPAAATEYEKLVQSSNVSSAVYFNLGNAYFKSAQFGRAIAAYRKAQLLAPRDPAIRANLQFARNEASSKVTETLRQQWINYFTVNEWTIATAVCLWIFFGLLILKQWRPESKNLVRLWSGVFGLATIFLGVCLAFAASDRFLTHPAVIVAQEAVVRRGPFDESQSYFTLRDGAEIQLGDRKDKWVEVIDRSGRTGWLPESQLIALNDGQ